MIIAYFNRLSPIYGLPRNATATLSFSESGSDCVNISGLHVRSVALTLMTVARRGLITGAVLNTGGLTRLFLRRSDLLPSSSYSLKQSWLVIPCLHSTQQTL